MRDLAVALRRGLCKHKFFNPPAFFKKKISLFFPRSVSLFDLHPPGVRDAFGCWAWFARSLPTLCAFTAAAAIVRRRRCTWLYRRFPTRKCYGKRAQVCDEAGVMPFQGRRTRMAGRTYTPPWRGGA